MQYSSKKIMQGIHTRCYANMLITLLVFYGILNSQLLFRQENLSRRYVYFPWKSAFRDHETISDMRESRKNLPISKCEVARAWPRKVHNAVRNACRSHEKTLLEIDG